MPNIKELLFIARQNLLDLSNRNRLLNCKLDSDSVIRIYDELPDQVYKMLVCDKKIMKFLPSKDQSDLDFNVDESEYDLIQPDDEENGNGQNKRHFDTNLQTKLSSNRLQTRLLRMDSNSKTAIEEQGINILFLALGFIKWYDTENSDIPKYAPLILIPLKLERKSATSKYNISWSQEDIETNESLFVKMQNDFKIELPRLPEETEDIQPTIYFEAVRKAVGVSKWDVIDDMAIGFFAFGKLRMWKDLDPGAWSKGKGPANNNMIRSILTNSSQEPSVYSDDEFVDNHDGINDIFLVKDADSSQILAVLDACNGKNIVIQGPPGTGKSQTITNIITNIMKSGKTVLFVAEKMAALEVVKRWLDQVGLGDSCLELHSFKARKTNVIESIRSTIESKKPVKADHNTESNEFNKQRKKLNDFASAMNTPIVDGGITAHRAIGIIERNNHIESNLEYIPIPSAKTWNSVKIRQNSEHLKLVAKHLDNIGNPQYHPWRGVMAQALLPVDIQKLDELSQSMITQFEKLLSLLELIVKPLGINAKYTLAHCLPIISLIDLILERPDSDIDSISNTVWMNGYSNISDLIVNGIEFTKLHSLLVEQINECALGLDFNETSIVIKQKGNSVWRLFYKDYRAARKYIRNSCKKNKKPKDYLQSLQVLDDLCKYKILKDSIVNNNDFGKKAFGKQWNNLESDWQTLQKVLIWVPQVIQVIKTNSILKNCNELNEDDMRSMRDDIANIEQNLRKSLNTWNELLTYDYNEAFGKTCEDTLLEQWISRLIDISSRIHAVYEWIEYRSLRDKCKDLKMETLSAVFDQGEITPNRLVAIYEYSVATEILKEASIKYSALKYFNGETHEHNIELFKSMDKKLIETTRQYLAAKLWEYIPQLTIGDPDLSPMHFLYNTLRKQRGLPPIRKLLERAGNVVTRIKPCFMMSPMSIAQFLPPDSIEFDVLVIDEASQMKPEDALGALARCKQCVIVGDSKQLPPTSFFEKVGEGDSEDENIGDSESILDAAAHPIGGNSGGRMLRWHYRSKHESLIAFSNKEFYDSKLNVFPSPKSKCSDLGLIGHYVENGVYARGQSRKNMIEAEVVAEAILKHVMNCGHLSLGVVALSKQQQEAITDKLEELRRQNSELEWFFDPSKLEPFFIKNLENVQGDERDVIFISIGYGKDQNGFCFMNFGPISSKGGWRRLNVLMTRAKRRCEVFHSIKPDEIRINNLSDSERNSQQGRVILRNYLQYIHTGQLEQPIISNQESESPFEDSVSEVLRERGYEIVQQVGVASFRIDIGVIDSDNPGCYLLGVECDGATYHSARSARDRDRLRQEVLENLGWKIHRIWSLDWYKDREKELRRLLLAIEIAKNESSAKINDEVVVKPPKHTVIKRNGSQKEAQYLYEMISTPYIKYRIKNIINEHPLDIIESSLVDIIVNITNVESPIHIDELNKRIAEAFGLQRSGARVQEAVSRALYQAISRNDITQKNDFLWNPKMNKLNIRNRSDFNISIDKVAPEEIKEAAKKINEISSGIDQNALIDNVAKSLGYKRLSTKIDQHIRETLKTS